MLLIIASYLATAIAPFGVFYGYQRYINRSTNKVLTKPDGIDLPKTGITVVDYVIPEESEEDFMKRLKFIHKKAWSAYTSDYGSTKILEASDRFLMMLILKYRNGEVTAKCGEHTIKFSDGTEVWISNKYYSYANIWNCPHRELRFETSKGRLSPYTFMCIVDLEMELSNFQEWKQSHDQYTRRRVTGLRSLLGV